MLYALMNYLLNHYPSMSYLRLFEYITFRVILSAITAFVFSLMIGPPLIRFFKRHRTTDTAWDYGLVNVEGKSGTPTMGGILILAAIGFATVLWNDLSNRFIQILIFAIIWFGFIGGIDDYLKLKYQSKLGLSEKHKLIGQMTFGGILSIVYLIPALSPVKAQFSTLLFIPFYKESIADLGIFYSLFIILVITAISNSVNLADGLDGLAIVPAFFVAIGFGIIAYIIGNIKMAEHFLFEYLSGAGEISIFCASILGAGIGFLWYNAYPAQIFMGDTGSLSLGGILGTISVLTKQEFLFLILGGVFVAEAFSVFVQKYISIPLLGRRYFFRAPLHHTLQYRGLAETKVVIRFWIIAAILALVAISSLKIR